MTEEKKQNPADPADPSVPPASTTPAGATGGGSGGALDGKGTEGGTENGTKPKVRKPTTEEQMDEMFELTAKLPEGNEVSVLRALASFQKEAFRQQKMMLEEMDKLRLQVHQERPPGAPWATPEGAPRQFGLTLHPGESPYPSNPGATQQASMAHIGQTAGATAWIPAPPAAVPTASQGAPRTPPHDTPPPPPRADASTGGTPGQERHDAPPNASRNTSPPEQPQGKRLVKIPNLRLEKTTFDYRSWELAFWQYVHMCQAAKVPLDEPSKIDAAKQMIGEHEGSSAYYRQAMEWSHVGRTVEEFLECVRDWHDERRTVLDPAGKPHREFCSLDVFIRPPGVKMIDWVSSPWLRHHLKSKFQVWPRSDAIIGQVMDVIGQHTCHLEALKPFIIDEDGDWGFTWDITKIRREVKTPSALLGMLRRWIEINTTLEAEFQQEMRKRNDKLKKDLDDHLAVQRLHTDKIRTSYRTVAVTDADYSDDEEVLAVGASRTYPRRESYPRGGRDSTRTSTTHTTTATGTPCPNCREKDGLDRYHDPKVCFHVTGGPHWWKVRRKEAKPKNGSAAGKS